MDRIEVLQEMLRYLGQTLREELLLVAVTGTYNEETVQAVRRYQELRELAVTGIVDRMTWDTLVAEVEAEQRRREPVRVCVLQDSVPGGTYPGERGDTVLILQILLNALRHNHAYEAIPLSGVYGSQTSDAVREFQRGNGMEPTGNADRATWHQISEEYNRLLVG